MKTRSCPSDSTADGSATAVLLNPGFATRHVVGAARKGRQRLEDLASFVDANECSALHASIEFELGKLAQATRRHDDARGHFERVLAVLDGFPEAGDFRQASERLSQLTELRRTR